LDEGDSGIESRVIDGVRDIAIGDIIDDHAIIGRSKNYQS
jgi:hypothetical protein